MKHIATSSEDIITTCRACSSKDLYLQKKFPRVIAFIIIAIGVVLTPKTLGISLLVVALIDFIIYQIVPWMVVCYRCRAEHLGLKRNPAHKEFDRHIDELYKYK